MESPSKGSVVAVKFPFSDLTSSKLRPALVAAKLERNDLILFQITSRFSAGHRLAEASTPTQWPGNLLLSEREE